MQLIQSQSFGQGSLSEGLFGHDRRDAIRALFALRWIQQNKLLNLPQLVDELFHRDSVPGALRLFVQMLQERDTEHAIKSMDANLAIGPVIHRSPPQPVSLFEAAKHSLDFLLAGVAHSHLLGGPMRAI